MTVTQKQEVIIVARVSSREQAEGYSIQQQLKECRTYTYKKGLKVFKEFKLIESAKDSCQRKKFNNEILGIIRNNPGISGIVCHKVDRFARNMQDAETLNAMGISQFFVQMDFPENALGVFMRRIASAQAAFYVDNLREEVLKGFKGCVEAGFLPHRPPFPYTTDKNQKRHVPEPAKAKRFLVMHSEWLSHPHTLDSLQQWLKDHDVIYTRSRATWPRSGLEVLLKSPFPTGHFEWHGKLYKGTHEAIISWEMYQAALDRFRAANRGQYKKRKHVYASGLIQCDCGNSVTAEIQKGRPYYKCPNARCPSRFNRTGERRRYIREDVLEEAMVEDVLTPLSVPAEIAAWAIDSLKAGEKRDQDAHRKRLGSLRGNIKKIEKRMDLLLEKYLDGYIEDELYHTGSVRISLRKRPSLPVTSHP